LASTLEATAAREAAPPMWKVRIVSCVPGSPIDCAAIRVRRMIGLPHERVKPRVPQPA
jgi:hypothetical protein